ncbi:hypothetical protein [Bradyrhizobium sp. USDA 3256]
MLGGSPRQTGFDAARSARRLAPWRPATVTSNVIMSWQGDMLSARAATCCATIPTRPPSENFVGNLIGAGIKPSSLITIEAQRDAVMTALLDWTERVRRRRPRRLLRPAIDGRAVAVRGGRVLHEFASLAAQRQL